jgi:hypothetical protein
LTGRDTPSKLGAFSAAVEPSDNHFDQCLYLATTCLICGLTPAKGIAIVPVTEPNARRMDFGSTEIVFANEAKLEQNFVTGAGCLFYLSL